MVVRLDNAADGGLIYIQGRSSACKRTTFSHQMDFEFDFDLCSLQYVSIQALQHVLARRAGKKINGILEYFSNISQKIGFDISCKLSPKRQFARNVKEYLQGKIRNKYNVCRLLDLPRVC